MATSVQPVEATVQSDKDKRRAHYRELAQNLQDFHDLLIKNIPKTHVLTNEDNSATFTLAEIKNHGKSLVKAVREPLKTTKRNVGENQRRGGFDKPAYYNDAIYEFMNAIDLGNSYEELPDGTYRDTGRRLKDDLPTLMQSGISTSGIMGATMAIYRRLTKDETKVDNRYMKSSPLMTKHFQSIYDQITKQDRDEGAEEVFDPMKFRSPRQQTIFARCKLEKLTPEQMLDLQRPEIIEQLKREQKIATMTCSALNPKKKKQK